MSVNNYHNVSVRLQEHEHKQLLELHDKYNRLTVGKVSLADVLRKALKDLHLSEFSKEEVKPASPQKPLNDVLRGDSVNPIEIHPNDVIDGQTAIDGFITIEEQLSQYETELRQATNSKKQPYSEAHIKKQLDIKRKELEASTIE